MPSFNVNVRLIAAACGKAKKIMKKLSIEFVDREAAADIKKAHEASVAQCLPALMAKLLVGTLS